MADGQDGWVQVSARVPREHLTRLEALARENDRTVSAEVRRAIRVYVKEREHGHQR